MVEGNFIFHVNNARDTVPPPSRQISETLPPIPLTQVKILVVCEFYMVDGTFVFSTVYSR